MPDSVRTSSQPVRKSAASDGKPQRNPRRAANAKPPLPATLAPQLATLVDSPPSDPQAWTYEIKFDGYRLLTRVDGADIKLFTRNGNDWTSRLVAPCRRPSQDRSCPPAGTTARWSCSTTKACPISAPCSRPLTRRRRTTSFSSCSTFPTSTVTTCARFRCANAVRSCKACSRNRPRQRVRFSDAFDAPAESVVASACKLGLEGVIAKRLDSTYVSRRSTAWIKLKCSQRQEFVIGGYTDPQGSRVGIGALLLGVHDDDRRSALCRQGGHRFRRPYPRYAEGASRQTALPRRARSPRPPRSKAGPTG